MIREFPIDEAQQTFHHVLSSTDTDTWTESGTIAEGWITSLYFDAAPHGSFQISLASRSGPVGLSDNRALLLLPALVSPDQLTEATAATISDEKPAGGKPGLAAPLRTLLRSATCRLRTLDNDVFKFPTTVSEFRFEGRWDDPGNWGYTIWFDYSNTKAESPNWFLTGPGPSSWPYWTDIPAANYESATGEGRSTFLGYFPIPQGQVWEQAYYHKIVLRQDSHDTWLYSEIWRNQYNVLPPAPTLLPRRSLWKENWFWQGQTSINGIDQLAEWYIITKEEFLFRP